MTAAQHPGEGEERIRVRAWWMLAVLILFYVLSLVDRGALSLLVVPIQKDLELSDIEMGIILGPAFAISYSIFGLPMGWASDRFPRRTIIFIAIVIWSAAAASSGLAWSFATLLLARILVGLGEAALSPIAYTLIADEFPPRRMTTAMAFYQAGAKLGGAASFTVVAVASAIAATYAVFDWPLVGPLEAWQLTLLFTGGPGLVLVFLVFSFREPPRRAPAGSEVEKPNFLPFLKGEWRIFLPMLLGMMMISTGVLSLGAWVPTFLERSYELKPAQYGPILSTVHLIGAAALLAKGMFVDWLRARGMIDAHLRFLSWIMIVSIPLVLVAFLVERSPWLFWLSYGAVEVLAGQFLMYFAATVQLFAPTLIRGRIMALFQAAFTIVGMGLGPLIVAVVTERIFADPLKLGWSLAIVVSLSFALALLALRASLPQVRRVTQQPIGSLAPT